MSNRTSSTTLSILGELADMGETARVEIQKWAVSKAPQVSEEYGRGILEASRVWIDKLLKPLGEKILMEVATELVMLGISNKLEEK